LYWLAGFPMPSRKDMLSSACGQVWKQSNEQNRQCSELHNRVGQILAGGDCILINAESQRDQVLVGI
jgi:hypothetical protein